MNNKSVSELLGQPPAPKAGRDRLIASGIELFYRHGFHAVGIDQVMENAGVSKSTFYKHFECKDDFVIACIETRDEWESQAWTRAAQKLGGDDPRDQLVAFFEVLDRWFNDDDFHGCLFINTASEFSDRRDPIHKAAARHKRKNRDHFRDLARSAGAADPESFADEFAILLDGTIVLRHVYDRDDAARVVRPAVMSLIERAIPRDTQADGQQSRTPDHIEH